MKVENHSDLLLYWFHHKTHISQKKRVLMMKSYHIQCPKCNNDHSFYRYGKNPDGYQKYLCRTCQHQFAPERPRAREEHCRKYPPCPVCGKAFLHHDHEHYSNYRCGDKKCNHSFFEWKSPAAVVSDRYSAYNIPVKSVFFTVPGTYAFKALRTMFPTI